MNIRLTWLILCSWQVFLNSFKFNFSLISYDPCTIFKWSCSYSKSLLFTSALKYLKSFWGRRNKICTWLHLQDVIVKDTKLLHFMASKCVFQCNVSINDDCIMACFSFLCSWWLYTLACYCIIHSLPIWLWFSAIEAFYQQ